MKVIVCVELRGDLRFAKACNLPIEPFFDLVIMAHVEKDVWSVVVNQIEISTASPMIIAYCHLEDDALPTTFEQFRGDPSWKQFGNYTSDEEVPDGPTEADCVAMLQDSE